MRCVNLKYIKPFQFKKFWFKKLIYKKICHFIHWKFISHSKFQAFTWSFWPITFLTISGGERTLNTYFAKCHIVIILANVKFGLSNATFKPPNHTFTLNKNKRNWDHDFVKGLSYTSMGKTCEVVIRSYTINECVISIFVPKISSIIQLQFFIHYIKFHSLWKIESTFDPLCSHFPNISSIVQLYFPTFYPLWIFFFIFWSIRQISIHSATFLHSFSFI